MEKPHVVISGVNGFVGQHLSRELINQDVSVIGVGHEPEPDRTISGLLEGYYSSDLTKEWPDIKEPVRAVIHLAGLAAVGPSFEEPQRYINGNSSMVTNLCEHYVDKNDGTPRIVIVSSGAIYDSNQPMPINEDGRIGFSSPYVISKVVTEHQAEYYRKRGLDCIVARPFNHIGPGQRPGFILPDMYERLAGLDESETVMSVGNLETRRDYTDVRDIVKAYGRLALTESLKYDTYNICSGESISGLEILQELKHAMGKEAVTFVIDEKLFRPTDAEEIVGSSSRLKNELGWYPTYNIKQTIADFVAWKEG